MSKSNDDFTPVDGAHFVMVPAENSEFSECVLVIIRCACSLSRLQNLNFATGDWNRTEWC